MKALSLQLGRGVAKQLVQNCTEAFCALLLHYALVIVMTLGRGTRDRPGEICHFERQNGKFPLMGQE